MTADAFFRESTVLIGHDHLCEEEHLLSMRPAGLTGKVTLVSVDAHVWSDLEDRERSMHEYKGFTVPALIQLEKVRRIIDSHSDVLCLARTVSEIRLARETGKAAIILGFEGAKPIETSLDLLHAFYRLGLRVLQLTWSGNDVCDRRDPPAIDGLTPFGRSLIREANRLGILIDPGHCSRKTFFQTLELSDKPVCVLHTTPRRTFPGGGDLDDDQVKAIAASGGVIGLHFFSHYLHPRRKATVMDLVRHIDTIVELTGIEHVALGGDYLPMTDQFRQGHGPAKSDFLGIPEDLDRYDKLPVIAHALLEQGYKKGHVRMILGENLLRVMDSVFQE